MYEERAMGNRETHQSRLINAFRVTIYVIVIAAQILDAIDNTAAGQSTDPLLVLVPMVLAFTDLTVLYWSNNNPRRFWNALPFVSLIAILVSINTIWSTIASSLWHSPHTELLLFGLAVIVASVYELFLWIDKNRLIIGGMEGSSSNEIRTYDS
ncbi:MAG: hypothetical protein ACXAEF_06715 [Candidatus Thorarchaeota archaeon]